MEITITRRFKKDGYTIGELKVNGKVFCDTLEPTDRGLKQTMSATKILSLKVAGQTAIPTGVYKVSLMYSPRFKARRPYIVGVRGFVGILIHEGNTAKNTEGCVLVGDNTVKGKVLNSKFQLGRLCSMMAEAINRHETIKLTII